MNSLNCSSTLSRIFIWQVYFKQSAYVELISLQATTFNRTKYLSRFSSIIHSSFFHLGWVMVIVWRLRGNIIRTAPCWVVWHNVHSQQHTYVSSSYRSSRLGLSHWDPYAMHRGGCLELYYCNMVEWSRWDSSLIWKTNWFPSVLWHCWFGHMTCKNRPRNDL